MKTVPPILSRLRAQSFLLSLLTLLISPGMILFPVGIQANPSGAAVVNGNVQFSGMGTSNLTVNQSSGTAIINWQDFSVGAGETTTFVQPGASALAINRVVSGNPSAIYGQLSANGQLMVINPNGIIVGPSGMINAAALTLSTLDASNQDLLDGGSTRFQGNTGAGVVNYGSIAAGDVTILGNFLNNAGDIVADRNVALGAGGDIIVNRTADGATISVRGAAPGGSRGIENSGNVRGGNAHLEAHGNSYALAINNSGTVRASGFNFSGGKLTLRAGSSGSVVNTGQIAARSGSGRGGDVEISGGDVILASGSVDAGGELGHDGGSIAVNGESVTVGSDTVVSADGVDGGNVSLEAAGTLSVGGEVTGTGSLGNGGRVDLVGDTVSVEGGAVVDASGRDGGRVRAGGGFQGNDDDIRNSSRTLAKSGARLRADGTMGDGGEVIVWSDGDTLLEADISARALGMVGNGGFVEVSGRQQLSFRGTANTSARNGVNGTLLLDPTDVTIGAAEDTNTLTMTDAALVAAVLTNNVVIHTSSGGSGNGDITIYSGADIQYDSPNSLSFFAHRNIFVNGDIKNHGTTDTAFAGTGHINLVAGWDGAGAELFAFDPTDGSGIPAVADPNISFADINAGTYGAFSSDGNIFMNDAALEPVEVGSARGETNVFGGILFMASGDHRGEFTQIGYRRENDTRGQAIAGLGVDGLIGTGDDVLINTGLDLDFDDGVTGDINVVTDLVLMQEGSSNPGSEDHTYVMIGHGGIRSNFNEVENRDEDEVNGGGDDPRDLLILQNSALGFEDFDQNGDAGDADFGSDAGNVTLGNGDNHGNITIDTGFLSMQGPDQDGFVQIGHGGYSREEGPNHRGGEFAVSNRDNVGNNNIEAVSIFGNMSGDITIDSAAIEMASGGYRDSHAMIGHGGTRIRGEHTGDITITTTLGGLRARSAPGASDDLSWRSRDRTYTQVGHGGYNSDFLFVDTLNNVDPGSGASDAYDTDGDIPRPDDSDAVFMAAGPTRDVSFDGEDIDDSSYPGDGVAINRVRGRISDDPGTTVNGIEGGVTNEAFGHSGNISLNLAGSLEMTAGNGDNAYSKVGHGGAAAEEGQPDDGNHYGDHRGDIFVQTGRNIIFSREAHQFDVDGEETTNRGVAAFVQLGHGGHDYHGGSTGNIEVISGGAVAFDAGRERAFAQMGHGGIGDSSNGGGNFREGHANGTHSGDIMLTAAGDVTFRSGFKGDRSYSQLGHGGYRQYADAPFSNSTDNLPEGGLPGDDLPFGTAVAGTPADLGHNGDITVSSGGDVSFVAGQTDLLPGQGYIERNGNRNYTMIGHGGEEARGDHWGNITVTAAGDFELEARGGWDGAHRNGWQNYPFLSNDRNDNAYTGRANFAQMGHGGVDSMHNNTTDHRGWVSDVIASGVQGDGIGVHGDSNITLNVTGDISVLAAQKAGTIGKPLQIDIGDSGSSGFEVFQGTVAGLSSEVVLIVPQEDSFTLSVDSTSTLQQLIDDWNTANPTKPIAVLDGDLTQTPTADIDFSTDVTPNQYFTTHGGWDIVTSAGGDDNWYLPLPVLHADDGYAQIGHGGKETSYLGSGGVANYQRRSGDVVITTQENPVDGLGHRGDIAINVGGDLRVEASDFRSAVSTGESLPALIFRDGGGVEEYQLGPGASDVINGNMRDPSESTGNYAQIGLGGNQSRGDHVGSITINGDGNLDLIAGEGQVAYAMIGGGGFDADRNDDDDAREGDIGITTTIDINIDGELTMNGGGLQNEDTTGLVGERTGGDSGPVDFNEGNETRGSFAMIGSGGVYTGGDHSGDVSVETGGDISVEAGNSARGAYAQIGNGGANAEGSGGDRSNRLEGNVTLVSRTGDIELFGSKPQLDTVDDRFAAPNAGNVSVGREAYVLIGNGGYSTDTGDDVAYTGDITVIAAEGDITLQGGGDEELANNTSAFRGMFVQIGNGGGKSDGNHSGFIKVSAGNDLTLIGGEGGLHPYAMIGHGGFDADGDLSGTIDIDVGNDLRMRRGANVDANGTEVRNAWAKIGHGDDQLDPNTGSDDGSGDWEGDILVSVGNSLFLENGENPLSSVGGETLPGDLFGGFALDTFDADPEARLEPETLEIVIAFLADPGNPVIYRDNGTGDLVNQADGTDVIEGVVNYETGEITFAPTDLDGVDEATASYTYFTDVGFGPLIGHVHEGGSATFGLDGNTYIAVSRTDPVSGSGMFSAEDGAAITSADLGNTTELRLYMPTVSQNDIADGVFLNSADFSRTAEGGVGVRGPAFDEQVGTEHFFVDFNTGAFGEPLGDYSDPAEGAYPSHSLGAYNLYYADPTSTAPAPPEPPMPPEPEVPNPGDILAALLSGDPFFLDQGFDVYDRPEDYFASLGLSPDEYAALVVLLESREDEDGGGAVGEGEAWVGPLGGDELSEFDLTDEEEERVRRIASLVGRVYYYSGDENQNAYSSYRLFGWPWSTFEVTIP